MTSKQKYPKSHKTDYLMVRVPYWLKQAFVNAVHDKSASETIRDFMRVYSQAPHEYDDTQKGKDS